LTLPLAVSLKRFFAPEWVFIFGISGAGQYRRTDARSCATGPRPVWQEHARARGLALRVG
jgi:hypothetical protein